MTDAPPVRLSDEPPALLATARRTVPADGLPEFFDTAYRAVLVALQRAGAEPAGPALAWYHGMPGGAFDVSAAFPVVGVPVGPLAPVPAAEGTDDPAPDAAGAAGDDRPALEVVVVERPGGPALTTEHVGPYDGLAAAWQRLERWRAEHAGPARGDFWEVYLTDPAGGVDPAAWRTALVLPLA
ncbi:GyrI-like domain-containing protein [Cellulomonas endophytica]|uniref:GyrI-like domain-containing protein n=1 Tax=Cellulomonas endophytica TaxID=2494735 RepID=UPI001012EBBF|nr:GyrI-like domain-containing protein [Cellulomonas endophytica]